MFLAITNYEFTISDSDQSEISKASEMLSSDLLASINRRKQQVDESCAVTSVGGTAGLSLQSKVSLFSSKYMDRSMTGFAGLQNLGATCYLNSFVQSLYMTPEFRKAVFE